MNLEYLILALVLIVLIYISTLIKNKGFLYFVIIIIIFLYLKILLDKQNANNKNTNKQNTNNQNTNYQNTNNQNNKEYFTSVNQAQVKLQEAVKDEKDVDVLKNQVMDLQSNVTDLTDVLKKHTLARALERGRDGQTYDLQSSQEKQDNELDSLDKELDVLLKLYRKESEELDKNKYHSLPVYSSCAVKNQGDLYMRDPNELSVQDLATELESKEVLKNLGIESQSSAKLLSQMQTGSSADNMDINLNLV